MSAETVEKQNPSKYKFDYPPKAKMWLAWDEAHAWAEHECEGRIDIRHLRNLANKEGMFRAGKYAGAPFPKLYPVERASFERWIKGHETGVKGRPVKKKKRKSDKAEANK